MAAEERRKIGRAFVQPLRRDIQNAVAASCRVDLYDLRMVIEAFIAASAAKLWISSAVVSLLGKA